MSALYKVVKKNGTINQIPAASNGSYVFEDIAPEGYAVIGVIGYDISSVIPHVWRMVPYGNDPSNNWMIAIYNTSPSNSIDAVITAYFLCAKQ